MIRARIYSFIYLGDGVLALNDWQDTFLLNGGRIFVSIPIDATEDVFLETHVIKFAHFEIPVSLECFFFLIFGTLGS